MPTRYLPIFRWKRGERVGLRHVTHQAKGRTLPIFLLGTDQFKAKAATKNHAAVPAPDLFSQQVAHDWGQLPFCLDGSSLPDGPVHHPISAIAASTRAAGLHLIPATNLGASAQYQAAILAIRQTDNHGVCLRIDLQEATSMAAWIPQWPHPLNQTDLVVDFGEAVAQVAALGAALDNVFLNLTHGPQWRTISIAGTSMPPNFGGFTAGLHLIPRTEYALWQRLAALALPYQLDCGDYASVSPGLTPPNIAWGFPINVKYSQPADFLICRGVRTDGPLGVDMDVQLVGHAASIVGYAARVLVANCWADDVINSIANGNSPPQGLEHWVQLSVNRHVELMAMILP